MSSDTISLENYYYKVWSHLAIGIPSVNFVRK